MNITEEKHYTHIQDYDTFLDKNHATWAVHDETYFKYVQEARANLTRATGTPLAELETKKEHDEVLKNNIEKIQDYLLAAATVKTSDSWRKLRRSFAVYLSASGLKQYSS